MDDFNDAVFEQMADRLNGFSGREISKLAIAWQASAYGSKNSIFTPEMMQECVDHHMTAHRQKEQWKDHEIISVQPPTNLIQ